MTVDMDAIINALVDEDRDAVQAMLETMDDADKTYMHGYLQGYTDAFRVINEAERDMTGFNNADVSDRIIAT